MGTLCLVQGNKEKEMWMKKMHHLEFPPIRITEFKIRDIFEKIENVSLLTQV